MPTLRQTENTSFRSGAYAASPARRHPAPMPALPAKTPQLPPKREPVQDPGKRLRSLLPLFGYVALAVIVVGIGLAYISGYMLVMKERNRAGSLQKFFKQEDDIRTRNQELIARLESKHNLEEMAARSNMIHAGDRPKFTVGKTTSLSLLPQSFQSVSPPINAGAPNAVDTSGESLKTEFDRAEMHKTSKQ